MRSEYIIETVIAILTLIWGLFILVYGCYSPLLKVRVESIDGREWIEHYAVWERNTLYTSFLGGSMTALSLFIIVVEVMIWLKK